MIDNIYVTVCPYYAPDVAHDEKFTFFVIHKSLTRTAYILFLVIYFATCSYWMSFVSKVDMSMEWIVKRFQRPILFVIGITTGVIFFAYFILLFVSEYHKDEYSVMDQITLYYFSVCLFLCAVAISGTSVILYTTVKKLMAVRILPFAQRTLALSVAEGVLLLIRALWTAIFMAHKDADLSEQQWPLHEMIALQLVEILPLIVMLFLMWPAEGKNSGINSMNVQVRSFLPDSDVVLYGSAGSYEQLPNAHSSQDVSQFASQSVTTSRSQSSYSDVDGLINSSQFGSGTFSSDRSYF